MDDIVAKRQKLKGMIQKQAEVITEFTTVFEFDEKADPDILTGIERTMASSYQDLSSGFFSMVELSGELLIEEVRHGNEH